MMKGLLIKDLKIMANQKRFFFILLFVVVIGLLFGDPSFEITFAIVMLGVFTTNTINYDTYNNGEAFLFTLPISRKGYVREKYMFLILVTVCSSVIIGGLSVAAMNMRQMEYSAGMVASLAASAFMATTVMAALVIPIRLKYGTERSQTIIFIIIGAIAVIVCMTLPMSLLNMADLESVFEKILGNSIIMVVGALAVIDVAILVSSYILSVRIMEKKEL